MPRTVSQAVRAKVIAQAGNRCGYCLTRQEYVPWILEIEHIIPRSKGGTDEEENLWLACRSCNLFKGDQTHGRDPLTGHNIGLFNPRQQQWKHHFHWSEDGISLVTLLVVELPWLPSI